jgi:ATP-dependent Clp protease adaptor protein ClpS
MGLKIFLAEPPNKPPDANKPGGSAGGGVKELVRTEDKVEKPRMYKVLLHNDDYTTMEFVVEVLIQVFHKSRVEATRVMLLVHNQGKGVAGIYTKEIAETKVSLSIDAARAAGYPLLATSEPE